MTKRYVKIYFYLLKLNDLALDTCGTHTDCVYPTDHLRKTEKPDTFASHNCTKDSPPHEFLGSAFSLIVIMQQATFLFWESLVSHLLMR